MAEPVLHLDVDAVMSHASTVDEVAAMLDQVANATAHLDQHDEIYGHWPSIYILPYLNLAQENATHQMRTSGNATAHLADLLRALTVDLSLTDTEAAQILSFREPGR